MGFDQIFRGIGVIKPRKYGREGGEKLSSALKRKRGRERT